MTRSNEVFMKKNVLGVAIFLVSVSGAFACEPCASRIQEEIEKTDKCIVQFLKESNGNDSLDIQTYYYLQGVRTGMQNSKDVVAHVEN